MSNHSLNPVDSHSLPPAAPIMEEAVAEALSIKAEGNARFASGDFDGAVASYSRALGLLPEDPHDRDAASARATLLSNRAAAKLKLGEDLEGVVRDCTTVLGLEDSNKKARFRRAEVRQPATRDGRRVQHLSGLKHQCASDSSRPAGVEPLTSR